MKISQLQQSLLVKTIAFARSFKQKSKNFQTITKDEIMQMSFNDEIIKKAQIEIDLTLKFGASFIPYFCDEYPKNLFSTQSPPIVLIALGNVNLLNQKSIAIVGSRSASYNGLKLAENFAQKLSQSGFVVISGLAKGIDSRAHIGAIKSTIAVIGSGINIRYPQENSKLYDDIIKNKSLIITEFPFNFNPIPANFPQRNKIIAGISLGTLVVEAGLKSGSLSTARLAFEFGREVFSIPGFALDPNYKGNNYLIKKNIAKLVEDVDDIIEDIPDFIEYKSKIQEIELKNLFSNIQENEKIIQTNQQNSQEKECEILKCLDSNQYIGINEICKRSNLDAATVSVKIMELELFGKVVSNGIGYCKKF